MSEITINNDGKVANIDAVYCLYRAMCEKAWVKRKNHSVEFPRHIDGKSIIVKITDLTTEKMFERGCDSVFFVELIEQEDKTTGWECEEVSK